MQRQRPFEPHSYRDLARSLEESGKYGLAAVQYEIVLAGTWHNRFQRLAQAGGPRGVRPHDAARRSARRPSASELADLFGERLEGMAADTKTERPARDHLVEHRRHRRRPVGDRAGRRRSASTRTAGRRSGGELSEDMTQGYGPERYRIDEGGEGDVHASWSITSAANPNLLGGETHVNVVVTRHAGTPQETTERHTVILKKKDEAVEVCRVEN